MFKLVVGLGNPGQEYENTRHNVGFWWAEELGRLTGASWQSETKFHAQVAKFNLAGKNIFLLKPLTFMNRSGLAVQALANFYKIAVQQILVVHDELDLLPGQAKLKLAGSHAGHNGLKDIQAALGSANFWRLRLGIDHPGSKEKVISWVLNKPPLEQRLDIQHAIDRSLKILPVLLAGEVDKATMLLHSANADYNSNK